MPAFSYNLKADISCLERPYCSFSHFQFYSFYESDTQLVMRNIMD